MITEIIEKHISIASGIENDTYFDHIPSGIQAPFIIANYPVNNIEKDTKDNYEAGEVQFRIFHNTLAEALSMADSLETALDSADFHTTNYTNIETTKVRRTELPIDQNSDIGGIGITYRYLYQKK